MRRTTMGFLSAAAAALVMVVPVGSARADIAQHERFEDSRTFTFDGCGFTIDIADTQWGTYLARSTDLGWDLEQIVVHGRATYTNPQTGAWFSLRADTTIRDVDARMVGDDLLEVTTRQAGSPFTLADSSGRVVVRDRGLLVFRAQFDLSSGEPEYLGEEPLVDRGAHPGYVLDICDVATELIG